MQWNGHKAFLINFLSMLLQCKKCTQKQKIVSGVEVWWENVLTLNAWLNLASFCGGVDHTPLAFAKATFSWLLLLTKKNLAPFMRYFSLDQYSADLKHAFWESKPVQQLINHYWKAVISCFKKTVFVVATRLCGQWQRREYRNRH